jgi:hypothetical protein
MGCPVLVMKLVLLDLPSGQILLYDNYYETNGVGFF